MILRTRALEGVVLFGLTPLAVQAWVPPQRWPDILALLAALVLLDGLRRLRILRKAWFGRLRRAERALMPRLLVRFCLCAALLVALIAWLAPDRLFELPRERPRLWLMLLAGYPLLSVLPQEWLYRRLFRRRYGPLFASTAGWIWASAAAFAWLHIVFGNLLAPLLCLIGGGFFAQTYARSRSLRLAVVEHSLYGMLVFSAGIGEYFYHAGAVLSA